MLETPSFSPAASPEAPDAVDREGVKNSNYNKGLVSRGSTYNDTRCDRLGFKFDDNARRCVDVNECYRLRLKS